jgi:hypothetical protein
MGNYYSSHYTRFAGRSRKPGMIGGEVSAWCKTEERDLGRNGKLYDFVYSANTLWNAGWQDELRWTWDRAIAARLPAIRARLGDAPSPALQPGARFEPVDLGGAAAAPLRDETGGKGGYDLGTLPDGKVVLRGVPFRFQRGLVAVEGEAVAGARLPARIELPVNGRAASVIFLHTASAAAASQSSLARRTGPQPMARYRVRYAGGEEEVVDVVYGWHLAEWNRRHGAPLAGMTHRHAGYVATYPVDPYWQGKTPAGADVTLYGLEWANPRPQQEIRAIETEAGEGAGDAALLLAAVTRVLR